MNNKEKLESIAFEINDLLTEYIAIHNKVLKEASSFLSLFKRVNFQGLCDDIKTILLKFNSKQKELGEFKSSLYDDLTQSQKDFFNCLTEYIDALAETVDALYKKVNLCYQRSQNKIVLSFEELQGVDKHYQECVSKYSRIGQKLNELYKLMEVEKKSPEIASECAKRMEIQREKWFDACLQLISSINKGRNKIENPTLNGTTEFIMKSFQLVHVLSFIHMQGYSEDIGEFTRLLCGQVCGSQYEDCVPYIDLYTKLKQEHRGEKFEEQFLLFAEDITLAIVGSPAGILLAPAVDVTVFDFYTRNLLLVAHVFGDDKTSNQLIQSLKRMHGLDQ